VLDLPDRAFPGIHNSDSGVFELDFTACPGVDKYADNTQRLHRRLRGVFARHRKDASAEVAVIANDHSEELAALLADVGRVAEEVHASLASRLRAAALFHIEADLQHDIHQCVCCCW
jgi:hypothetical protein